MEVQTHINRLSQICYVGNFQTQVMENDQKALGKKKTNDAYQK